MLELKKYLITSLERNCGQMIKLKEFQEKMVDKLLRFTAPDYKVNELLIKAPTGSGKTICLLSWINDYIISTHDDVVFVWFTPGAGELEEQSKDKAKGFTNIKSQSVDEALNQGFEKETVTFINYERVTGKKKKAMMTDSEKDNLEDKINEAFRKGYHFILVIDEAHRNDTKKARDIISKFKASKIVRVSATIENPNNPDKIEFYEIDENDVINSGLITKSVIVNEGIDIDINVENEFDLLFNAAEIKRKEILNAYQDKNINNINPLVLVQLPDKTDNEDFLVQKIENYIKKNLKKDYENSTLGIWLSDKKKNHFNISDLNNPVEYLIIKQAVATGWDAPRAKILIKIRENMGEVFTIQTIGRIRRMPQPKLGHYNIDVLDNAYLYTFDKDFLNGAFAVGQAVAPTPILKLKESAKTLSLISERVYNQEIEKDEKVIFKNLFLGLKQAWHTTEDFNENAGIIRNYGMIIGTTIKTTFKQGRFSTLENAERLEDVERLIEVDYRKNRIDLLHVFHELSRVTHLPISKVEVILKKLFLDNKKMEKEKLLKLNSQEWTAFILNNWRYLREEFKKIDIQLSLTLDLSEIQQNDFKFPLEERYTYNPELPSRIINTNAYDGYLSSTIATRPSLVERLFERYVEQNADIIDFIYKNGDKGTQYFSLTYKSNGGLHHFYPDYIVQLKNKEVYIIETKAGKTKDGIDKNIDPYSPVKFESLKDYSLRHNVKWAFVRDFNEELWYLNSGIWSDDMYRWTTIDKLFEEK